MTIGIIKEDFIDMILKEDIKKGNQIFKNDRKNQKNIILVFPGRKNQRNKKTKISYEQKKGFKSIKSSKHVFHMQKNKE